MKKLSLLIIGGGPTGLGAALRAQEKGLDWHLLEAAPEFGGLACSVVDEQGFTWDMGGHVQFSHYDTFDRYMERALGPEGWLTHQRESWVWVLKNWVPYPFQNNLHRLPVAERWACVKGLLDAYRKQFAGPKVPAVHFHDWILKTFGQGIADVFMLPYNFKVWAYPPAEMDSHWIGERVSVPSLEGVLRSVCTGEDAVSWGPNATFRFPREGGTGAIWRALGRTLPAARVSLGQAVVAVNVADRTVLTADGRAWGFDHLISTMPLNGLLEMMNPALSGPAAPGVASALRFSASHIVGVGLQGTPPAHLRTRCWMYFPASNSPYYRVTLFSNYSPHNVPRPGEQWSLMTETSESAAKPVARARLVDETISALVEDGLIEDPSAICSKAYFHLPQGYPTPFLGRDSVVDPILRELERHRVFSRGRFGAWKYEVANQDHSFAQGYECVERIASGGGAECEPTLHTPEVVNNRRNV